MPRGALPIHEETKNILSPNLLTELVTDPKHFRRYYLKNVLSPVLSYPVFFDGTLFRLGRCTAAGYQKVVSTGTVFEHNDVKSGTSADAYTGGIAFDRIVQRVDIWIFTHDVVIKISRDGVTYGDEFYIIAGATYSFDCSVHSIDIKSRVGGSHGVYQFNGWW